MMLATARRRATRRAAFTLLEILVVVAIVVILAGVGVVATTSYLEKAKQSKAQLGCKALADAAEAYFVDPNGSGQFPQALQELVTPAFGRSMLKNGQQDLLDPWGKAYQYEVRQKQDGTQYAYVFTTADGNIPISQFGVGEKATPPQ